MDSTLSELGLSNRQALIVVTHNQNNLHSRGESSQNQTYGSIDAGSSNASEGYWGSVKRILSYANVFSYLGRSSPTSPAQESQSGIWQYSEYSNSPSAYDSCILWLVTEIFSIYFHLNHPSFDQICFHLNQLLAVKCDSRLLIALPVAGPNPSLQNNLRDGGKPSPDESAPATAGSSSKSRLLSSRYGGNIHTLKHDDDDRFSDKNAFWNGNSTQYGGNDDGK